MKLKNFKEFSNTNKINEARVNVDLTGDLEGMDMVRRRVVSSADSFSFIPGEPITVEEVDAHFGSFDAWFIIKLSNGDEIEFTLDGDGGSVHKEELVFRIDGEEIKNPRNAANDVASSDAPTRIALRYYKKILNNRT